MLRALSETDNAYIGYRDLLERELLSQGSGELRTLENTLDRAWQALGALPRQELTMLSLDMLGRYLPEQELP